MKLDLGSFAFGANLKTGGGTPSWGTALGQGKDLKFTALGWENIVTGMLYKSIPTNKVWMPIGKGGHVYTGIEDEGMQLAALFDKVYINEILIPAPFLMVIYRDSSVSWNGRRTLKYGDKIEYQQDDNTRITNANFVAVARETLRLSDDANWIISDLYIEDQEILHMFAGIVNPNKSETYDNGELRKAAWIEAIKHTLSKSSIYKKYFVGEESRTSPKDTQDSFQKIFYGAPGTGKSYKIKKILGEYEGCPEDKKAPKENIFRTTFHPDSDYSTFVGAYKPTRGKRPLYGLFGKDTIRMKDGEDLFEDMITYKFIPQSFLNAYIQAYRKPEDKVYLIIEEINRGNCAQIFGDLFQLLDRNANGCSEYTIKADADLRAFLEEELGKDNPGIKDGELCLPSNLYIYATMNTSDQSLFPIDSAFKRRWDWEYEPIKYKNTNWKIVIADTEYSWVSFQRKVNDKILSATNSEDKMLGDYFVNSLDGVITDKVLLNKILFYLWNDVCKDGEGDIFKISETEDVSFSELYGDGGKQKLISMLNYLGVSKFENNDEDVDDGMFDNDDQTLSSVRYSINGGTPFQKTYLAAELFKKYTELNPELSVEQIISNWKNLCDKPKHLIENEFGYQEYIQSSNSDKVRIERRFEPIEYKGQKVYLWKDWGDGKNGNIIPFVDLINGSDWGIAIKRV